jgi:spermidine synthase
VEISFTAYSANDGISTVCAANDGISTVRAAIDEVGTVRADFAVDDQIAVTQNLESRPWGRVVIQWELLDAAGVRGTGAELRLYRRGGEFSIRLEGRELMNSRVHASEEALGRLACKPIADRPGARVLVGGLGMGFTLAAVLSKLGPDADVIVSELVPEVVSWNRGALGELAKYPLRDPRVAVRAVDVAELLKVERDHYDAILFDVDNGPEALPQSGNRWLYDRAGLAAARGALRSGGVLAVWSAGPNRAFTERLCAVGFEAEQIQVRARGYTRGAHHTIWIARRISCRSDPSARWRSPGTRRTRTHR